MTCVTAVPTTGRIWSTAARPAIALPDQVDGRRNVAVVDAAGGVFAGGGGEQFLDDNLKGSK